MQELLEQYIALHAQSVRDYACFYLKPTPKNAEIMHQSMAQVAACQAEGLKMGLNAVDLMKAAGVLA